MPVLEHHHEFLFEPSLEPAERFCVVTITRGVAHDFEYEATLGDALVEGAGRGVRQSAAVIDMDTRKVIASFTT